MKQGAASNKESGTAIYRHREWRGLRDTAYDFTKWAQLWVILIRWALAHPAQNVKAVLRYRWMFSYLCVPSFFDRLCAGHRGAGLRAARLNLNHMAKDVTDTLTTIFSADGHLHPGSRKAAEKSKRIICFDELLPTLLGKGFPNCETLLFQMYPMFLPSLINQHSGVHYISQTELYGLPADVCPLPSFEARLAIEDDYPKIGCCMVTSNMPCDGSIMTTMLQDRRTGLPTQPLNVPLRWKREEVQDYAVAEILSTITFLEEHTGETFDWDALKAACEVWNEQQRGIPMCRVRQDLLDPTSISRRDMRNDVNLFMQTVMNETPLDPSLVEFDDDESW